MPTITPTDNKGYLQFGSARANSPTGLYTMNFRS